MAKRKKRIKKKALQKPDEYFNLNGFEGARFGKEFFLRTHHTENDIGVIKKLLKESKPKYEEKLNDELEAAIRIMKRYSPESLIHNSYLHLVVHHMHSGEHIDETEDSVLSLYLLEFIQNMLVSVEGGFGEDHIPEDQFTLLLSHIKKHREILNQNVLIAEFANKTTEVDRFQLQSILHWVNVRGERYSSHEDSTLRDLLTKQTKILESCFSITATDLVNEIMKIHHSLTRGMIESMQTMKDIHDECASDLEFFINNHPNCTKELLVEHNHKIIEDKGLTETVEKAMNNIQGMGLFDVEEITSLPRQFIEAFSFSLGEDIAFREHNGLKFSPLNITPVRKRPFIRVKDKYYCFNVGVLFDHIYRSIQRHIFRSHSELKNEWLQNQTEASERIPIDLLSKILCPDLIIESAYYPQNGSMKQLCELDAILIFKGFMFIIEVKAGSFTYTSPYDDFDAHISSLKNLSEKPAEQGNRFLDYFKSSKKTVSLYDKNGNETHTFPKEDIWDSCICAVTVDPFTDLTAKSANLSELGINLPSPSTWTISIDDLRVFSDIFSSPIRFLHFVRTRLRAQSCEQLNLNDELDHLGMYIEHNLYAQYAEEGFSASGAKLDFIGYRTPIDEYFQNLLIMPDETPSPLCQRIPAKINEIINYVESQDLDRDLIQLCLYLLDCAGETRDDISDSINCSLLKLRELRRTVYISTQGDVRISIACWNSSIYRPQPKHFINHVYTDLVAQDQNDRHALQLYFNDKEEIVDATWEHLSINDLNDAQKNAFYLKANELREQRVKSYTSKSGKIGRNQKCPCGSNLKYKKCCGKFN